MLKIRHLSNKIFQKNIFWPSDHGSWVFLLSPLLIGIFSAEQTSFNILYLIIGLLAAFFLRQPASVAVKSLSRRRSKQALPYALFWIIVYSLFGLYSIVLLFIKGYHALLWALIPGGIVFTWHLWLVSRRSERNQMGVDIIASGILALAAPAAYWVGTGTSGLLGWVLWILAWLQSAASIVYAFLRLSQRKLVEVPGRNELIKIGSRALIYSGFNFIFAFVLSLTSSIPAFLWVPYLLQFLETIWGVFNPAIGKKPNSIGIRQLFVSTLFTLIFIIIWNLTII